jgi:hypothetical protein
MTRVHPRSPQTPFAYRNGRPRPTARAPRQSALSTSVPRVTPPSRRTAKSDRCSKSGRRSASSRRTSIGAGELGAWRSVTRAVQRIGRPAQVKLTPAMVRQHDALHVMRERLLNVLRMAFKAATLMGLLIWTNLDALNTFNHEREFCETLDPCDVLPCWFRSASIPKLVHVTRHGLTAEVRVLVAHDRLVWAHEPPRSHAQCAHAHAPRPAQHPRPRRSARAPMILALAAFTIGGCAARVLTAAPISPFARWSSSRLPGATASTVNITALNPCVSSAAIAFSDAARSRFTYNCAVITCTSATLILPG